MINLLPASAKKGIKIEYWIRVMSVWFILWSFALILGAALLLPVYVQVGTKISAISEAASAASAKVTNYENVSKSLSQSSQQAHFATKETSLRNFTEYIALFESLEDQGISIGGMMINRKASELQPIILSGQAVDRQSLAAFRDRLLSQPDIQDVDLPIANLANDKDISFTVTVTLASKSEV